MHEITFLFGAGASFGAGGILPERPPLGTSLFPELRRLFPRSWGALPVELSRAFEGNFESGMAQASSRSSQAIPALMRDMAIYFAQFRIADDRCLYVRLVRDLVERSLLGRVVFSTLNYECLIEAAITKSGWPIDYFGDVAAEAVPVLKLHGSCNMFCKDLQASPGIFYGSGITFEGGIRVLAKPNDVIDECLNRTALAPAMCLFMEGKPTSISPSVVTEIQQRWARFVTGSKLVACVGVHPHPIDEHIWRPLAETNARLVYVGDDSTFKAWAAEARSGRPSAYLSSRFNAAYVDLLREIENYEAHAGGP